jgi:hypothetical protein
MKAVTRTLSAMVVASAPLAIPGVRAQDASFGCKVLLCAAASAPSWSGIAYCVPVMQDLFRRLAHGGSWPTCPEGHASGLGYEPYYPCPAGLTPMQSRGDDGQDLVPAQNGNVCADTALPQRACWDGGRDESCGTTYRTVPREARSEPNYVDISTANGVQRFYFSLRGY